MDSAALYSAPTRRSRHNPHTRQTFTQSPRRSDWRFSSVRRIARPNLQAVRVDVPNMGKGTTRKPETGARLLEELDRLERELVSLRQELERSEQLASLGTLLGLIAHEFNNILTPIHGYTSAALARPDDTRFTQKALERAAAGSARAAQIAESILSLAGDPRFDQSRGVEIGADPVSAFQDALACLELDEIQIDVQAPKPCPGVRIRPAVLQQVLMNLSLNAIRAMGGAGRLTLRVSRSTGNTVLIEITDTGCGIEASLMERLFDPFQSTPLPVRGQVCAIPKSGTGLGLSLCQRFIQQAGGEISVRSQVGQGTTFSIWLDPV